MKRQVKTHYVTLFLLSFIILFTACKANKKISEINKNESSSLAYEPLEKALLWKIEGNTLPTSSYLFGTIHMIDRSDYFLPVGTELAIEASKKMVFEIDMDDMTDMGAQMGMLTKAFMSDGLTLKDLMNDEDYELVVAHFKEKGLPMFMMERIKPMFLSALADMDLEGMSLGGENSNVVSYEMEFYDKAQKNNLEVEGLESIDYQMSIFDSIPYNTQADMLVEAVKMSGNNEGMEALIESYKNQDIEALVESIDEEEGMKDFGDLLLKNRNLNWIPIMNEMMKDGTHFFAVGAGHLAGKFGVIHLLKEEGYTLTPILESKEIKKI